MLTFLLDRLLPTPRQALSPEVEVIIAVCNAANWLDLLVRHHIDLGLDPLYIVDRRSSDASLDILRHHGARVLVHSGTYPRVESLLFDVLPTLKKKWALRLDDDEVASPALIRWINANLGRLKTSAVGLPRQWVAMTDVQNPCSAAVMTRCVKAGDGWGADRQYRLFRPEVVVPVETIHTCGFVLPRFTEAPENAAFYHMDWLVRSYQQRKAKIDRYEAQETGMGKKFAGYYLPEEQGADFYRFKPVRDRSIARLARALNERTRQSQELPMKEFRSIRLLKKLNGAIRR